MTAPIYIVALLMIVFSGCHKTLAHARTIIIPLSENNISPLSNIITVAKKGGDFSDPIKALLSITNASQSSPYLIVIAPGTYNLTSPLIMKEFVNINGTGEELTYLTKSFPESETSRAIIIGSNNASLSDLSIVQQPNGEPFVYGIYNLNASPELKRLSIDLGRGDPSSFINRSQNLYGIYNNDASPTIKNIKISLIGSSVSSSGIHSLNSSSPIIQNVDINIQANSTSSHYGVFSNGGNISNAGVQTIEQLTVLIKGGVRAINYGVYLNHAVHLNDVNIQVSGDAASYAVFATFLAKAKVNNSWLQGNTNAVFINGDTATIDLKRTTLIGGVNNNKANCILTDNGIGNELSSSCQ